MLKNRMILVFFLLCSGIMNTFIFSGCSESDGNSEDGAVDNENDKADAFDENDDFLESPDGCNQELPSVISLTEEYCDTQFPDSCLFSGCDACQVCYVDLSCLPRDSFDAPNCYCNGDGLCHDLCNDNNDCEVDEECIGLGWADGTDIVPTVCLKVCWKKDDPTTEQCTP